MLFLVIGVNFIILTIPIRLLINNRVYKQLRAK